MIEIQRTEQFPLHKTEAAEINAELLAALKYARRNVKASECDIAFIDAAITRAEGGASCNYFSGDGRVCNKCGNIHRAEGGAA